VGNDALPGTGTKVVFALTSIAVAAKEELLYRGALQTLLARRTTWLCAIVLSNIVFTLYHYGAQPFTAHNILEFFAMGCMLGLIYYGTGSLTTVITVHAVYDAIWTFTPIMPQPFPRAWGSLMLLVALSLCVAWALQRARRDGPAVRGETSPQK
jgi:membrane protease YdiL (CAAX protease family)